MTERMKPPARRTGRTLGGGAKKTPPPPPPPAAELTHEQYAAEQATAQDEGHLSASEPQAQPVPSAVPAEASAHSRTDAVPAVAQTSAQPTAQAPSGSVPEPAASQPVGPDVVAPEAGPGGEPVEQQVTPVVPAALPGASAPQATQPAEPVAQQGPSPVTSAVADMAPAGEVAVRPAASPVAAGTAFPVRTDGPGSHQEQYVRPEAAPSEGTPWAHGPGRPKDIPETAVILNQRIITRESLDSSVPAALKLKKRIKRFALDNELDHLPIGDFVSVALDEWLTARGF
ncbi:hypothetical protein ACFXOM_34800 [Streptomyces sp. NPDC059169]|uniref:hypothetical protein n=1 Tax=Streptomyces sp. NPDC059169 TaxID=3346754 RepID=UPI003698D5B4